MEDIHDMEGFLPSFSFLGGLSFADQICILLSEVQRPFQKKIGTFTKSTIFEGLGISIIQNSLGFLGHLVFGAMTGGPPKYTIQTP